MRTLIGQAHRFRGTPLAVLAVLFPHDRAGRARVDPDAVPNLVLATVAGVLEEGAGVVADSDTPAKLVAEAPRLRVWSGDDALTLPMLSVGAAGVVSVVSHLAGHRIAEMLASHDKGDVDGAARIDRELRPLYEVLFITANPIPLKAALEMVGLPAGPVRLPLVDATADERDRIRSVLERLGLI